MRLLTHILLLLFCGLNLFAQDGVYQSVSESEGVQINLTRAPEKGAKVWTGDLARFVTDGVTHSKIEGRDRIVWVGRFIGTRPNWLLVKIGDEVFAAAGIVGPARLTKEGVSSSRGLAQRCKVSFSVKDAVEAVELEALLRNQGRLKPQRDTTDQSTPTQKVNLNNGAESQPTGKNPSR